MKRGGTKAKKNAKMKMGGYGFWMIESRFYGFFWFSVFHSVISTSCSNLLGECSSTGLA